MTTLAESFLADLDDLSDDDNDDAEEDNINKDEVHKDDDDDDTNGFADVHSNGNEKKGEQQQQHPH